jgi:hypothetical protein
MHVASIVVDPQKLLKGVYNLWVGYTAAKLIPDKPIRICHGPYYQPLVTGDKILDWVANIIQKPWQVGLAFSLIGFENTF